MEAKKKERVSIFIDGSNFYYSTAKKGRKIDFKKLIIELTGNRKLVNAFYYVAPLDFKTNPKKYWKHQKFLNILKMIPKFNVVLCNLRKIKNEDGKFEFVVKGDDIQLAHDLLMYAVKDLYDTAIIVSGDEDFVPIIKTVQEMEKKVGNAFFKESSSYLLRRKCDLSINMDKLLPKIIKK